MLCKKTLLIYEYPHESPGTEKNKHYPVLAWNESGYGIIASFRNGIFFEELTNNRIQVRYWADLPRLEDLK